MTVYKNLSSKCGLKPELLLAGLIGNKGNQIKIIALYFVSFFSNMDVEILVKISSF